MKAIKRFKSAYKRYLWEERCMDHFKQKISKDPEEHKKFREDLKYFHASLFYNVLMAENMQQLLLYVNSELDMLGWIHGFNKRTYEIGNANKSFLILILEETKDFEFELERNKDIKRKSGVSLRKWFHPRGICDRVRGFFRGIFSHLSRKKDKEKG
jgi:hypothetical protein